MATYSSIFAWRIPCIAHGVTESRTQLSNFRFHFPGGTSGEEPTFQCRRLRTRVGSLGQEDPLGEEMTAYSSTLAWRPHGQRSLAGCSPWGRREADTTERTHMHWMFTIYIYTHTHIYKFGSVALMFDSLPPHGLQHARLPCPSTSPRAPSNSCPSSR